MPDQDAPDKKLLPMHWPVTLELQRYFFATEVTEVTEDTEDTEDVALERQG